MSGHSRWSEIRRKLGAPERARVDAIGEQMAEAERLEESAARSQDRLRDALGIPTEMSIDFTTPQAPEDDAE